MQRLINERRGYALEEKIAIIRERQAIRAWCALHAYEDAVSVLDELQERDKYWSKPENKYRIGGLVLAKETPGILARGKRQSEPEPYSIDWFIRNQELRRAGLLQA